MMARRIVLNVIDLRDIFAAVFLRDVLDHLAAAALAEIDVDVGSTRSGLRKRSKMRS